jgi:hypothetical protein
MITSEFARAIKLGRATGELSGHDGPDSAARSLLATVIGTSVLAKTSNDHDQLRRTINEAIAAV